MAFVRPLLPSHISFSPTIVLFPWSHTARGVATKFRLGREDGFRLGGRIHVSENHLPPNSDFSSDFAHFVLKILKNLEILVSVQEFFLKNCDFRWGHPPGILNRGGGGGKRTPSPPPHPRWRRPCILYTLSGLDAVFRLFPSPLK